VDAIDEHAINTVKISQNARWRLYQQFKVTARYVWIIGNRNMGIRRPAKDQVPWFFKQKTPSSGRTGCDMNFNTRLSLFSLVF
jgi:hypothetical protein